jgi:glyoxylase-like metal-dependent hydrolase (beta-lactamase superfamily II)
MKLQQVSDSCFAVLHERNRLCDANSGLVNLGGGVVIDTQADLAHARRMIELFGRVWPGMPRRVVNTRGDGAHVWGNQLFEGAEIIAHRAVPGRMNEAADLQAVRKLLADARRLLPRLRLRVVHPGALAAARQLQRDYDFDGITPVPPTTLFEDRLVLDLDGTEAHLIHVGLGREAGDTIVHVPSEGVLFAGDLVFRDCAPMGGPGTYAGWLQALDLVIWLDPEVIVPGHGPVCGIEGAMEMRAYLEHVHEEASRCLERGLTPLQASKRIDLGPYERWRSPARLYANVERAYRELRGEPAETPFDMTATFDAIYDVAKARRCAVEF